MTLSDLKLNIYNHFQTNDELVLPDDNLKILVISDTPDLHAAAIKTALSSFEETGLVKKVEYVEGKKNKTAYILEKPLQSYTQNVNIDGITAALISKVFNNLNLKQVGASQSNPLAITQFEIETMATIAEQYIIANKSKEQN